MRGFTNPRPVLLAVWLAALSLLTLSSAIPVYASGVVTNCTTFGSGTGTLQDALATGGTITFGCSGQLTGVFYTITSDTTIDGNGYDVTLLSALSVEAGATLTVRGLKFSGSGNALRNLGTLIVENSQFFDNSNATEGESGAAIRNFGVLTVRDSNFTNNRVGFRTAGGAISTSGDATIERSSFTGNHGGAIASYGDLTILNSSFTDNKASSDVGIGAFGTAVVSDGTATITGSTFTRDSVRNVGIMGFTGNTMIQSVFINGWYGGPRQRDAIPGQTTINATTFTNSSIANDTGTLNVNTSSMIGAQDVAVRNGGGSWNLDRLVTATTNITNTTIANSNTTAIVNGYIQRYGENIITQGYMTLTNVTIVGNKKAFANDFGSITARNTLLAQNSDGNCFGSATLTAVNSLSDDGSCSGFTQVTTEQLGLGALTTSYIPLNAGSAAIDAGDASVCPSTDQRGVTRPQGAGCDVGAYEFEGGSLFVNGIVQCPAGSTQIDIVNWDAVLTMQYNQTLDVEFTLSSDSANGILLVKSMVGHPEAGCPGSGSPLCEDQDNESFNVLVNNIQTGFVPDHGNDQWQQFSFPLPLSAGTHAIRFAHTLQTGNNPFGSVALNAAYCLSNSVLPAPQTAGGTDGVQQQAIVSAPTMPLCAALDGTTSSVVRTNMPADAYGVHCNVLAQNGSGNMAAIGVQSVLDMGVIHAVDVFAPSSGVLGSAEICLQGQGDLVFLSASTSPRSVQPVAAVNRDSYTCGTINGEGTLVLVQRSGAVVPPAAQNVPAATTPLADCRVTTLNMLNLRSEPSAEGSVIAVVPYDLTLTATEFTSGWYRVIFEDGQGWLSAAYLTTAGSCG